MNGKGGVSGRQRGVECDEMGGEIRKKHSPENAQLQQSSEANRCKMHHRCSFWGEKAFGK